MNESLFWQDGFPKERRAELVAKLLYAGDPNARIPNDEGLRPDRVDDFYAAVGFTSVGDFDARMEKARAKYRYGDGPEEIQAPQALPSADPFEKFFVQEKLKTPAIEAPAVEVPVVEVLKPKVRRPRAARVTIPEQPIVPVPALRIEPVIEAPAVEAPIIEAATPRVPESAPVLRAEDRVSAFARGVLAWLGRKPQAAERAETGADDTVDPARMREVVFELFSKELGANAFQVGVGADPKARAHVEAANRLERAIATSARLDGRVRESMNERLGALRTAYQDRMNETARAQSGELQGGLDAVAVAQERGGAHSALRVLAGRRAQVTDDLVAFREQVEHAALQRGGGVSVAAIDGAFRDAWRSAWDEQSLRRETPAQRAMNAVEALSVLGAKAEDLGPLEESLPRLRLLEGNSRSGVARLVLDARISIQEHIDRALPGAERAMKRAA